MTAVARKPGPHVGKLTIRWSGQRWVLRRGTWRMADSRYWHEMHELMLRIHDRERKAAQREAYLHG